MRPNPQRVSQRRAVENYNAESRFVLHATVDRTGYARRYSFEGTQVMADIWRDMRGEGYWFVMESDAGVWIVTTIKTTIKNTLAPWGLRLGAHMVFDDAETAVAFAVMRASRGAEL